MPAEGRSLGSGLTQQVVKERRLGNLATPASVQKLQTALHAKAKTEAEYRFYALYDKIYRGDILVHAYAQCRSNKGAPGMDGQDFADVEAYGVKLWLGELANVLKDETYRPDPIRRVFIPKPNGKLRPLGISTLRDRVCMTATMLVLNPIFEADLPPEQYAYRQGRNAQQAVIDAEETLYRGYLEVVDTDLADYFGSIPHADLMRSLARRIVDSRVLHLIKMWLECAVEETDDQGRKKRTTEAKDSGRGIPQGSPITPLTQKVISSLSASWRGGGVPRCLICVSRSNMFASYDSVHQGGQSAAAERGPSSARTQFGVGRGGAKSVAQVRFVTTPSLSISRASRRTWPSSAGRGSLDSHHAKAATKHRARIALVCHQQRVDARRDRNTCAESLSERSTKAWLSDVQDVSPSKSISTMRLTACVRRSLRRFMSSWCPHNSASPAHV